MYRLFKLGYHPDPINKNGVFSYIADCPFDYKRPNKNIVLKIFKENWEPINQFKWKHVLLEDACKIQNILWFHGLAPRIYDLITIETPKGKFWAQVTDFVPEKKRGKLQQEVGIKFREVLKEYGIKIIAIDPNSHHDYVDQIVDVDNLVFKDDSYKQKVIKMVQEDAGWGSSPKTYQGVSELGIGGQRDLSGRLPLYKFDEIDFNGKTVIDYGGSSGHVGRECLKRGAIRIVSLDLDKVSNAGFHLSNYLGYFNIDFYGGNFRHDRSDVYETIKQLTGLEKFDVVLYLSCQQLLMPDYLDKIVGEVYILEGHVPDKEETYRPRLEQIFNKVDYTGMTRDHGPRPVFICKEAHGKN